MLIKISPPNIQLFSQGDNTDQQVKNIIKVIQRAHILCLYLLTSQLEKHRYQIQYY